MTAKPVEGDRLVVGKLTSDLEKHGAGERFLVVDGRAAQDVFLLDRNGNVLNGIGEKFEVVHITYEEFVIVEFAERDEDVDEVGKRGVGEMKGEEFDLVGGRVETHLSDPFNFGVHHFAKISQVLGIQRRHETLLVLRIETPGSAGDLLRVRHTQFFHCFIAFNDDGSIGEKGNGKEKREWG